MFIATIAAPAQGCVPWRLEPTDDPLQDIRDAIPRASDGKQIGDLSTAISVMYVSKRSPGSERSTNLLQVGDPN
jgi:hypothetical protein